MKIVRIKNRLEDSSRDILINVMFLGTILTEIQLAIKGSYNKKQQKYQDFEHYLYELERSFLGPVMESANIWAHLDERSKHFINENQVCCSIEHEC